jgi:hypothetical protein
MRATKTLFSALSLSTFPFKKELLGVTAAIGLVILAWQLSTYLFRNWDSLSLLTKIGGVVGVLTLLTAAVYAIGAAFGIAAIGEFAFLAPILALTAAIAALMIGLYELYNYFNKPIYDNGETPNTLQETQIDNMGADFGVDSRSSFIPRNFRNSMQGQTELSTLRNSPTYAPINQQNSDMSSSQDINLYLDLDGERVYQNQIKYHEREGARNSRGTPS